MLKLMNIVDDSVAYEIKKTYLSNAPDGSLTVLYDDDKFLGLIDYTIDMDLVAHIVAVFVVNEARGKGYGDFLTRATMNSLTLAGLPVTVDYEDNKGYFDKFGFTLQEGKPFVTAKDIVFPSKCKHD